MILEVQDLDSDGDFYGDNLECNSLLPCKSRQTLRARLGTERDLRLNEVVAYLRNLPSAAVDYFSEVFKLVKFNTSCCTCHECCE